MGSAFRNPVHRRATIGRGLMGALLATVGGMLLLYGALCNEIQVIAEANPLTGNLASSRSPSSVLVERLRRESMSAWVRESLQEKTTTWIADMMVPEPDVVRGVTIGAFETLETGDIRMIRDLDGAYFCNT